MKKYSKVILNLCLAIGLVIVFSTCASSKNNMTREEIENRAILDSNIANMISGENQAILIIPGGSCILRSINGSRIFWGATMKTTYYKIPSGDLRIRIDPYNSSLSSFSSTNVDFNATPGQVYQINILGRQLQFTDITQSINP